MKNVTITLDEKTVAWASNEAAQQNISLSRFVGELLHKTMQQSREYERAMREYLARAPVKLKRGGTRYPSRFERHIRDRSL